MFAVFITVWTRKTENHSPILSKLFWRFFRIPIAVANFSAEVSVSSLIAPAHDRRDLGAEVSFDWCPLARLYIDGDESDFRLQDDPICALE